MAPAPRSVSAAVFRRIAEAEGYKLFVSTDLNWVLKREKSKAHLILVPREGDILALEILESLLDQIGIGYKEYLGYLEKFKIPPA